MDEEDHRHPAAGEWPDDLVSADTLIGHGLRPTLTDYRCVVSVLPPLLRRVTPSEVAQRLQAERRGTPFLLHLDGDGGQRIVDLAADGRMSIGRQASCGVPLTWDSEVSRLHAVLERVGDAWTLSDDGLSRNGSFVNGRRIRGRCRLRDGDSITIGRTLIVYRDAPLDAPRTTEATTQLEPPHLTPAQLRVLVALCDDGHGAPPSNRELAEALFLSVDTVKSHLRELFGAFGIPDLPQNRKRAELVRRAYEVGLVR
jgi:DNA-binding CsgD family transcriptional regulator